MKRLGVLVCTAPLLVGACRRDVPGPAPTASASVAAVPSIAPAPIPRDSRLALAESVIKTWQTSQNQLNFAAYAELYAPAFRGTKRVGNESFRFNRARWLSDRKPMFVPGLKVDVQQLQVALAGANVVASFRQEFATPAFRDVGRKLIALAATPDGWRIVREEMLSSDVLGGGGSVATLPGFFFARPDAVVLRSQIDERWLTPERREVAKRYAAWPDHPETEEPEEDALKPNEVQLPPEVTAFVGKTLYVSRAPVNGVQPAPCEARVERLRVVNTGTEVFEGTRYAAHYGHLFDAVVLGTFHKPCPGALWASETPPAAQYVPEPPSPELREGAQKAFTRSAGYAASEFTLVGDTSQQLLFVRGFKESPDGERQYKNLLFAVTERKPPLTPLGPLDIDVVPRLAFDANGDGRLDVLTQPSGDWGVVWLLQRDGTRVTVTPVYQTPDFVCPG